MNNFIKRKLIRILSIILILILPIVSFMGCNDKAASTLQNVSNAEQNKQEESKINTEETPEYKFLKNNYSQLDLCDNSDFLAVAIEDQGIAYSPKSQQFLSNHAGMTKQEMMIPFIVVES